MNKIKLLCFVTCAGLLLLSGCAGQAQYETVEQICVADIQKPEAMQIAEETIGKMHFTVAKIDAERGYIRTRPLAGAEFFEFWRSDNIGSFNSAEANLHTIRRIIELDITEAPSQQDGKLCIGCDVKVQRLSLSERKDSDRALKYDKFSGRELRTSRQKLELYSEQKAWIDLGKDQKLATVILKRIEKQIAKLQKERRL